MGDPAQHRVEHFSKLLDVHAQRRQPCNLAMGYRSLFLRIVNDFIFSSVPDKLRSLANENFDDPICVATFDAINWTEWLATNFPTLNALAHLLPRSLVTLATSNYESVYQLNGFVEDLVRHEKDPNTPTNINCMLQRLMNGHLDSKSESSTPLSDEILATEAEVTMFGGVIDLANIAPFGTFMVSQDSQFQQRLYEELKSAWPDRNRPVPSYEVLRHLPLLDGVIKESMRLTHGALTGPPRRVGPGGTQIGGQYIPANTVVAAPSYFVHMDPVAYPHPEKFDPERWINNDQPGPIVIFSKGRRMCPAVHLAHIEMFAAFAAVFRRYRVTPYETT
ncbi:hypothetical protein DL770_003650 [Monosporascus sp. CRB-9-2]|nr:hypothetical protein DL770_003650 [Monosporascus sp. CRB-9-2]